MKNRGVRVNRNLYIPPDELRFSYSTSGGPGGQHANKAATRAELSWSVTESRVLGPRQRAQIQRRLASRIDSSGTLRLSSDRYRSQLRNRNEVLERLAAVVGGALRREKKRVPTAPSRSAKDKRIKAKKHRSETKRRRRVRPEDY